MYPEPAANSNHEEKEAIDKEGVVRNDNRCKGKSQSKSPGTLPDVILSKPARGLLMKLLEVNSQYRLRSLRQLQQTAFYMGFNFEEVKAKKSSTKKMLRQYEDKNEFLSDVAAIPVDKEIFNTFDQNLDVQ